MTYSLAHCHFLPHRPYSTSRAGKTYPALSVISFAAAIRSSLLNGAAKVPSGDECFHVPFPLAVVRLWKDPGDGP